MRFYLIQHFTRDGNRFRNERPFIQHDTLRPLRYGGVRDFRPRRNAFLREIFKDLGRPNDGHVGCLCLIHDTHLKRIPARSPILRSEAPEGNCARLCLALALCAVSRATPRNHDTHSVPGFVSSLSGIAPA